MEEHSAVIYVLENRNVDVMLVRVHITFMSVQMWSK